MFTLQPAELPDPGRRTVLVIDDQTINIRAIYQTLASDYEVLMATGGEAGLAACRQHQPDLVLLDLVMPGMSGLEVAARLKADPLTRGIPLLFVTASTDVDEESRCWEAGAVDFVTKPFNPMTLRRRVGVHLALKLQAETLQKMAYVDGLTEIPNRRYFNERVAAELARARRDGTGLVLMLADVDFFKRYNDHYGHQAGDACLRQVAGAFTRILQRPADFAARYGGEEFALLAPGAGYAAAQVLSAGLRREMHALALPHARSDAARCVTLSVGAVWTDQARDVDVDSLLRLADQQLYRAKEAGRDRACIASAA
ncbi:diguanylate cyclase domain-containing protein [Massilia oculi]|jgi:diguanylate cyclase (GGDEF)-like protein|uniref:diguanylate cyclase n=1 Tax=Massilia oculi TaxID=945844 RepID=A0A2S2DGP5_9BURK|nr:diguanylate cyclase [Massilia oculi]AWL04046.1 diguanylate cyclase response regulator [Massilia oculi]